MIAGFALAAWLLMAIVAPALLSARGVVGPLISLARSPLSGIVWLLLGVAASLLIGLAVARLTTTNRGLFTWGISLAALAMRFGNADDLAFSNASLAAAAVETLLWAGVVLGGTLLIFRVAGPLPEIQKLPGDRSLISTRALPGLALAILVLPVVWLLARHDLKGQALGAVILGATASGLAGRLAAPHVQPVLLYAAPIIFGAIGHLAAMMFLTEPIQNTPATGGLLRLAYPMPIDYAAGSLVGVAMGVAWARSFLTPAHGAARPT